MDFKELYNQLPKEIKVFVEYILPSAILTAGIEYLTSLKVESIYVAAIINLVLIFLRELKPRYERLKKEQE